MNLETYMSQRGWNHVIDDFWIDGVKQSPLPDGARQVPFTELAGDTNPSTVYDFARSTYGEFEGPVEFYIWTPDTEAPYEYLTVAGRVFERPRTEPGVAPAAKTLIVGAMFIFAVSGLLFATIGGHK